jgi:hypothetical protein
VKLISQTSLFPAHAVKEKKTGGKDFPDFSPGEREKIAYFLNQRAVDLAGTMRPADQKLSTALSREAERFCRCGSDFAVSACQPCRYDFRTPVSCNSRLCSKCGRRIVKRLQEPLEKMLRSLPKRKGWGLMLVTLTTTTDRYDGLPVRKDYRRLQRETADFFRLYYGKYEAHMTARGRVIETKQRYAYERNELGKRVKIPRRPIIRQGRNGLVEDWRVYRGAGVIATMELGTRKGTNRAGELNNNLHTHALVWAPYISQKRLSESWHKITGDSYIVDVRSVRSIKQAVWYVLKYMSKPPALESYAELANFAESAKGSRRIKTSGEFYRSLQKEKNTDVKRCCPGCQGQLEFIKVETILDLESTTIMPLWPILFRLARGEPVELIRRHDPILENAQRLIREAMGGAYPIL